MTVNELIEALKAFPPDMRIWMQGETGSGIWPVVLAKVNELDPHGSKVGYLLIYPAGDEEVVVSRAAVYACVYGHRWAAEGRVLECPTCGTDEIHRHKHR